MGFDAYMKARRKPMKPLSILGRDITGVISWNMNDTCNYRCSYCTQRFMPLRTHRLEELQSYLRAFERLPGHWEIKLSGGEPFQQPGLDQIVEGLVSQGHLISIQTNFSASARKIERFIEASRGALHVFAASLHLEYDTAESFIDKAALVIPHLAPGASFCVTSVATPDRLAQLRDEVAPLFARHKIAFKVQPEKVRGVLRDYTPQQREVLRELGGHNNTGHIAPNFRGRLCYAGANYFVIKSNGEAYRCYPASRSEGHQARLGSFLEGIELLDGPKLCPYNHCNCTVPIHRGMIQGVKAPIQTDGPAMEPEG